MIAAGTFVILTGSGTGSAQIPPGPELRATLTTDQQTYFVGEDVPVRYCLENISRTTFEAWVGGTWRFKPAVFDASGKAMPQFDLFNPDELSGPQRIDPGMRWCSNYQLLQFARIDQAGSYTVRAALEFVRPTSLGPEAETTFTLRMPTESDAEHILTELERKPPDSFGSSRDLYRGVTVRPAVFLGPLRRRAEDGNINAVRAIGEMRVPDSTRTLIELAQNPNSSVARAAASLLTVRLPSAFAGVLGISQLGGILGTGDGFGTDVRLSAESWLPEFAPAVRKFAKSFLTSTETQVVQTGAFMIASVGESEDAPDVEAALTRAIAVIPSLSSETQMYPRPRGAAGQLVRASKALVGRGYRTKDPGKTTGEAVFWLVALALDSKPADWEKSMASILANDSAYIREIALEQIQTPVSDAFLAPVTLAIESSDLDLQVAGCHLAERAKLMSLRNSISSVYRKTNEFWVLNACGNALYSFGSRMEMMEIAVDRLADPAAPPQLIDDFLSVLYGVFEGTTGGGGQIPTPAQGQVLSARWRTFLTAHRADIEAGKRWSLEDPEVTTDLVPSGWSLSRNGKPNWPPR
jgi:hypothetical protein